MELLLGHHAAIDSHGTTNHETCAWRAKPHDGRCDFFRLAKAADWLPCYHRFHDLGIVILGNSGSHGCIDNARAHSVDPNPLRGIVECSRARQADDTVLAC